MSLNILIVDDDTLARQRMRQLLARCSKGLCGAVEEAGDAARAAGLMRHRRYDLLLLDVQMPGDNGLALAQSLRGLPERPAVVFVSGYSEHALDAFDADAIDYLTKPVRPERLERALAKAAGLNAPPRRAHDDDGDCLRIVNRGQAQRLPLAEVLYLRAEHKRLLAVTANGHFTLDGTLTDLEARYAGQLLRVHRHTLVLMHAVGTVRKLDGPASDSQWQISLRGSNECLPVARRLVPRVRARMLSGRP